jgi:hypothetical protein
MSSKIKAKVTVTMTEIKRQDGAMLSVEVENLVDSKFSSELSLLIAQVVHKLSPGAGELVSFPKGELQ